MNTSPSFAAAVVAHVVLNNTRPYTLPQYDDDIDVLEAQPSAIVLYNDEVNTFNWVIESLVDICGHESVQAEQCAWIVHTRGRCSVKEGSISELEAMCNELCRRGLSATIE